MFYCSRRRGGSNAEESMSSGLESTNSHAETTPRLVAFFVVQMWFNLRGEMGRGEYQLEVRKHN
jgi:hypothetical protein